MNTNKQYISLTFLCTAVYFISYVSRINLAAVMVDLVQTGFTTKQTAALALTDRSVSVDDPALAAEERLALVLGSEGDGLAESIIDSCNYTVRIPMSHGVDSLNVAAAAAVAFWELRIR